MSLRWSEDEYALFMQHMGIKRQRIPPAPVSEAAWMATVRRIAKDAGYSFQYHVFDSRRTVYGYPDLTLVHREPGRPLYMVELKTDTGQVTQAQQAWLDALGGCTGVVSACWRPKDLEEICRLLRT